MMENDVKNKLNIVGTGFLKDSKSGGKIISFLPEVPVTAFLDDLLFILTAPYNGELYAPAYCRLQDKSRIPNNLPKEESIFEEVHSIGYCRTKQNTIIVCAPDIHAKVDLDKLVVIGTVPFEGKRTAPFYFKRKLYQKNRSELES